VGDVAKIVIAKLEATYGLPPSADPARLGIAYVESLREFADDVLEEAVRLTIRTYTGRRIWPEPGILVAAAGKCSAAKAAKSSPRPGSMPTHERTADAMLLSAMGQQAAREGWVLGFWQHVAQTGSAPTAADRWRLIEAARYVDRCASGAVQMGAFHGPLQRLAESMLHRRKVLEARALGEPEPERPEQTRPSAAREEAPRNAWRAADRTAFAGLNASPNSSLHRGG
jgi:hypothetical protein